MPYIGRGPELGVRSRFIYTATANQTSFSGNDDAGISLAYTDTLYMDVYQNGVLLVPATDYAASTGTSVVLVQGASVDDTVEMLVHDIFSVADSVSAKDGGSFAGNVGMGGTLSVTGTGTFTGLVDAAIIDGVNFKVNGGQGTDGQVLTSTGTGVAWEASAGKVLQVVSTTLNSTVSTTTTDTSGVGVDVGLNVTITTAALNSSFLILINVGVMGGTSGGGLILSRGGTKIGVGVDSSARNGVTLRGVQHVSDSNHGVGGSGSYKDSPSVAAGTDITYKAGLVAQSGTYYLNRSGAGADTSLVYGSYTISTITVIEIGA